MSKYHFTTVASGDYLYKFLVMYKTLKYHCTDFKLFAMCVEDDIYNILNDMKLPDIMPLKVDDVNNDELKKARRERSYLEYCWMLKSVTLHYVMNLYHDTDYFAHLDSDLCFFAGPESIFNEAPNASLYLIDHNNSQRFLHTYETSGRFNTGFVGCKNDHIARKAIDWWMKKCIESCSSTPDSSKKIFGDQRYVEEWPRIFGNVHIVKSKGINVSVWNIEGYKVSIRNNEVFVNEDRLIFYHFSGFSIINETEFNLSWFYKIADEPLNLIYIPYMKLLKEVIIEIKQRYPYFNKGFTDIRLVQQVHLYKLN